MDSAVVDLVLGRIVSILENEASLIGGVHDALNELKLELRSMRSFLEDADRRKSLTQRERSWVADVRDMCYPVEDIIEEYMYHSNNESRVGKLARLLHGAIHMPKNLRVRHRLAKKIQGINKRLKSIPERNQRYSGGQIERTMSHEEIDDDQKRAQNQSELLVFAKGDHVVGIEEEKQLLIEWLTKGEAERMVISVVGMGGCGKSTLVANAYNDPIVKRHFDCYAWVTVSQTYVINDLLKRMISELYHSEKKGVPIDLSSMAFKDLAEMLIDYLRPKKYLIVLDDVWRNLWKDLEIILSDEGLGSRLIFTTRNNEIANAHFGVRSHVLHVKRLEDREAWDLFCSIAFFRYGLPRTSSGTIESIARDLVRKCNGLPLAILALGGAMSSKKTESEWRDFQASLGHQLSNNNDFQEVKDRFLLFSFKDLPYRLKQCFLYCCIFPEDYPIKRKRLVRLWMAEGFVEEVRGKTPEAVADDYLLELVHRNMLQVVERNPLGRPKKCKMHDMMRELSLSISVKEQFSTVYDGQETEEKVSWSARRLSIQTDTIIKEKSLNGISQL